MPQHPTDQFLQAECPRLREQIAAPCKGLDELRARQQATAAVAILEFNEAFQAEFATTFMAHFHRARLAELMPLFLVNMGGSTWLRRLH